MEEWRKEAKNDKRRERMNEDWNGEERKVGKKGEERNKQALSS